jgi:hypothetical protein
MQRFFNDVVDWPVIFAKWLPDVVQEAGISQRCPGCKTSNYFHLKLDWQRSGAGICKRCESNEGLDWLKLAYEILTETAEQIVRGEIASQAELMPLRRPKHKQVDDPNELLVAQRLMKLNRLTPDNQNAGTCFINRLDIPFTGELEDLYFDPNVMLPVKRRKTRRCSAIVLVLRDVNNNRVGIESIYLTADGQRITVSECMFKARGQNAFKGVGVRLSALQPTVLVAVNIESALVLQARFPNHAVIATLTENALKTLQLPALVCNVHIAIEPDGTNVDAANELAVRLRKNGCQVDFIHHVQTADRARLAEVC